MIPDLLLGLVGVLVDLLTLALPSGEPPFADEMGEWAEMLHGWLFAFEALLPVGDQVELIRWICVVFLPGWLAYLGVKFVVAHVPFLGVGN